MALQKRSFGRKRTLVSRISKHTNIRADIVEEILNGLVDIAIEDTLNDGYFYLRDLFVVDAHEWKAYSFDNKFSPSRKRLKVRLSDRIKALWKIQQDNFHGEKGHITKNNWQEVYRSYVEEKNNKNRSDNTSQNLQNIQKNHNNHVENSEDFDNPFLLDDDE